MYLLTILWLWSKNCETKILIGLRFRREFVFVVNRVTEFLYIRFWSQIINIFSNCNFFKIMFDKFLLTKSFRFCSFGLILIIFICFYKYNSLDEFYLPPQLAFFKDNLTVSSNNSTLITYLYCLLDAKALQSNWKHKSQNLESWKVLRKKNLF